MFQLGACTGPVNSESENAIIHQTVRRQATCDRNGPCVWRHRNVCYLNFNFSFSAY